MTNTCHFSKGLKNVNQVYSFYLQLLGHFFCQSKKICIVALYIRLICWMGTNRLVVGYHWLIPTWHRCETLEQKVGRGSGWWVGLAEAERPNDRPSWNCCSTLRLNQTTTTGYAAGRTRCTPTLSPGPTLWSGSRARRRTGTTGHPSDFGNTLLANK